MMNLEKAEVPEKIDLDTLTGADKWILSKVNTLAKEVTENLDKYELGIAVQKVYDFIWEEFCDWYIEMVKPRLYSETDTTKAAALWTLKTVLIKRTQAAASVHAVYHRRNLLHAASGRGVHHDFCMAGVSGCMELCKRRKSRLRRSRKQSVRSVTCAPA